MNTFSSNLLNYYDKYARPLPWRENPTPYRVWLSEIMLQQTTVQTVMPYYKTFLEHFPTIGDLAAADLEEVYRLWQGLGYYSRAKNLHACAQTIVNDYAGDFPESEKELLKLPGIGPYTASAILSMAFNKKHSVVDGNVERVITRLYRIETPLPEAKPIIKEKAQALNSAERPRDYSNAIMDLGATVCTPKAPKCDVCPVKQNCKSYGKDDITSFPRKMPKKEKPIKNGIAFVIHNKKGEILLQKRHKTGLLAHLWQTPNKGWEDTEKTLPTPTPDSLTTTAEKKTSIKHTFTHFTLLLDVHVYYVDHFSLEDGHWFNLENLPPLPTLFKKVINA